MSGTTSFFADLADVSARLYTSPLTKRATELGVIRPEDSLIPRQRDSNEITNGMLRRYVPKCADLSICSQDDFDAIALSLNTRPRETPGWKALLAVYTGHVARLQLQAD